MIVLGIPGSAQEFEARCLSPLGWHYGQQFAGTGHWRVKFDRLYSSISSAAAELTEHAAALGCTVCFGARMSDLRGAFADHAVVVIIAHWRGSVVSEADLLPGWQVRVKEVLADSSSPVGIVLRETHLENELLEPNVLVRNLNLAIETGAFQRFLPFGLGEEIALHNRIRATLSRDIIDAGLEGVLEAGNSIELFDGLHPASTMLTAIPASFRGVLDLSCCDSAVLATLVRLERGDTVSIFSNNNLLPPMPQMQLIDATLKRLSDNPELDYWTTRLSLTNALGAWQRANLH